MPGALPMGIPYTMPPTGVPWIVWPTGPGSIATGEKGAETWETGKPPSAACSAAIGTFPYASCAGPGTPG